MSSHSHHQRWSGSATNLSPTLLGHRLHQEIRSGLMPMAGLNLRGEAHSPLLVVGGLYEDL